MDRLNKIVSILLPLLPWLLVGLLVVLCVIVLILIAKKFIDTWRLFYSKQELVNELVATMEENAESEESEDAEEPEEKVLTIGDIEKLNEESK